MRFTEYRYEGAFISAELATKQANIKANLGEGADLLANGLAVISERLKKDRLRYRDYGPYWWSIKQLLNNKGDQLGDSDNPVMRDFYTGKSPLETLICAEKFRDDYLATSFQYNNQFILNADTSEIIEIVDGDMEG